MAHGLFNLTCTGARLSAFIVAGILYFALSTQTLADTDGKNVQRSPNDPASPPPHHAQHVDTKAVEGMRAQANEGLLHGEFEAARREFEEILRILPGDPAAQRDAARAAQAAGKFEYAAAALERAHHFEEHSRDPEIHYLRGEALFVLKRDEEARREHRIAELEIGNDPRERMPRLWLARIYARRGYYVLAHQLYETMWPPAPKVDTEVAINEADAHLMNEDWTGGVEVLRRYLDRDPKSVRGREMLAWALEAKGDLDGELVVRQSLAEDEPTTANKRDYGRALERAANFRAAHQQYDGALHLAGRDADAALVTSTERMLYRTTPEVGGGLQYRRDPQARSLRAQAGAAVPFGSRHSVSLIAWHDESHTADNRALLPGGGIVTGVGPSVMLGARGGASVLVGGDLRYSRATFGENGVAYDGSQTWRVGGMAEVDAPLGKNIQVNVRGDLNEQWSEAPVTIQEGGVTSGGTGHFYLFPRDRRLLLDAGAQVRRLTLAPTDGDPFPSPAFQQLYFIGGDVVLWSNPSQLLRGEALDERMVRRTYLNDAGIISYRHYQLFTDAFSSDNLSTARIVLAPRAAIHNLSAIFRTVFAKQRAGFDLRGGMGYDTSRQRVLTQAGASLVIAPSWAHRLVISYDMARETATGLQGTLHTGWLSYHADL
jgi:Flp pilus assembly protein TadD